MPLNVELLNSSFAQVKDRSSEFTAKFYSNLFSDYPEVEPLFANTQMEEQKKKLFDSLVLVVDNLQKPDILSQTLKGLGTKHVQYGVLPLHYPMVGESLLKTFDSFLGSDYTRSQASVGRCLYSGCSVDIRRGRLFARSSKFEELN